MPEIPLTWLDLYLLRVVLLHHSGGPVESPMQRLALAAAIYSLAAHLDDAAEIQRAAANYLKQSAQAF